MATTKMAHGSAVSNTTRREALTGAAVVAVAGIAAAHVAGAAAADHPDAHLFALWEDYKAAVIEREPFREAAMTVSFHDPRAAEIEAADDARYYACQRIARTIAETDARTPDGLLVKLAAIKAHAGARLDDRDEWEVGQGAMASLIRSAEAMGGRFDG